MPAARISERLARGGALAVLLLVGFAVVDDYGVVWDETAQRSLAAATWLYVAGADDTLLAHQDRTYGVAFEAPLLLAELVLGLEDARAVMLLRHALTHVFFLLGGVACGALARRLCGSRALALLATLLFVLQPRLYAHSFFNTKDIPFLALFAITLLLAHRAFKRGDCAGFVTLGVAVGLLTNIRVLGAMLFVAVAALRALDLARASGRDRKRALATLLAFVGASAATLYGAWPYLWTDPITRFAEAVARMADHPTRIVSLFQGELVAGADLPAHYVPTWLAITTPPALLCLGCLGLLVTLREAVSRRRAAIANTDLRMRLLLITTLTLPVVVVVLIDANLSNGWRQMYFLHAPLTLLGVVGLHALASRFGVFGRRVVVGGAALSVAGTAAEMAAIHPNQSLYFNYAVDRATPERLAARYELDYYETAFRQALVLLLERSPKDIVTVRMRYNALIPDILPADQRRRVRVATLATPVLAEYHIMNDRHYRHTGRRLSAYAPTAHRVTVFNNTVARVLTLDASALAPAAAAAYRADYQRATAGEPTLTAAFDVRLSDNRLYFLKRRCQGRDVFPHFNVTATPEDANALPKPARRLGFEDLGFHFGLRGVYLNGDCLASLPLPPYRLKALVVGQYLKRPNRWNRPQRDTLWRASVPLRAHETIDRASASM